MLRRTYYTNFFFFFFNDPATTETYPLPLHDALPISARPARAVLRRRLHGDGGWGRRLPVPAGAAPPSGGGATGRRDGHAGGGRARSRRRGARDAEIGRAHV